MGGQMHPCFYQCKVPCGGLYSSGGGNQVDDCIQQQGNIHGRQAELFPKTLTGHSRALEAVFVREDKQREEYQRQPRAAKQAHAITGESVSSASSARQRGRNSRAKKPRAEAMPWIRAERSDRSLVSPVGNRAARIPAPRAKPPRDTANPPPATGRPAPRRRRRRRQWSKAISPATPATGGRPGPRDRPFCPER